MKKLFLILIIAGLMLMAFKEVKELAFYVPQKWPAPEYDFSKNLPNPAKIELGKVLFYDPLLSRDNTISCASCHSQYTAFAHVDHDLSHGIEDRKGTRNTPALMNLAWQKRFMWDGSVHHLDMQPLAPISHPAEMDDKIENVVNRLQKSILYKDFFLKAFGDTAVTGERTLKSISQFMLCLVSANSKYDKVMRKEMEFTAQEKNGYNIFKANCASCHKEPLFTTSEFANNGLPVDPTLNDPGRSKITGQASDSLKFKIPTLRNIEFSYPYMHDGRFKTIPDVINHYTSGIQDGRTLAPDLKKPMKLSSDQKVDLTSFLLTLTDVEFLFNPNFSYPHHLLQREKRNEIKPASH